MAILSECTMCHKRQSVKNRICIRCNEDLLRLKRINKVKYWIVYRLPNKKQRRELVGYSLEEARAAEGKRRGQKRENRLFEIKPESKMTFSELTDWYLKQESVKRKAYYKTFLYNTEKFNQEFGDVLVSKIKPADLENFQAMRKSAGFSDSYVDQQIKSAQTIVNKAFDNDLVNGDIVKAFRRVKRLLKRNSNARNTILTVEQFRQLMQHLPLHSQHIVATAYYTGMRRGEILALTWDKVNLKERYIKLDAADTKDREPRTIPICDELYLILKNIPKNICDNHVFLFRGKPIRDIRDAIRKACKKIGLTFGRKGFVFHDLRHTFNTNMRKAGVPESVIMKITGHSTREMFDRYNSVDVEDLSEAVGKMGRYLDAL
jgi:integrase